MRRGAFSIGGSVYEAFGNTAASTLESGRRVWDEAVLAISDDERDQEYLREITQRERDFGMRSKWASLIRNATQLEPDDVVPGFWTRDLPSALGYSAAFLSGGVAGAAVRIPLWFTTGLLGSAVGGLSGYEDAVASGASEEDASMSYLINAAAGTSEAWPLFSIAKRLNKYSGGKLANVLKGKVDQLKIKSSVKGYIAKEAAKGALEEAMQEVFQTGMQNWTAADLVGYDSTRKLSENIWEAGSTGGTVGGMLSLLAAGVGVKMRGTRLQSMVDQLGELEEDRLPLDQAQLALDVKRKWELIGSSNDQLASENAERLNRLTGPQRVAFNQISRIHMEEGPFLSDSSHIEHGTYEQRLRNREVITPDGPMTFDEWRKSEHKVAIKIAGPPTQEIVPVFDELIGDLGEFLGKLSESLRIIQNPQEKTLIDFSNTATRSSLGSMEVLNLDQNGEWSRDRVDTGTTIILNGTHTAKVATAFRMATFAGAETLQTVKQAIYDVALHETGHTWLQTHLQGILRQAAVDVLAGKTGTESVRLARAVREGYTKYLLDAFANSERDWVGRNMEAHIASRFYGGQTFPESLQHIPNAQFSSGPVPSHSNNGRLYWHNIHEWWARSVARTLSGEFGKDAADYGLVPPEMMKGSTLEQIRQELKAIYAALPQEYKIYRTAEQFIDAMGSQLVLLDAAKTQRSKELFEAILKGNIEERELLSEHTAWDTHLDRYNKGWRWGATLPQLSWINKHIKQVVNYVTDVGKWDALRKRLMASANTLVSEGRELGKETANRVFTTLLEEVADEAYLSESELVTRLGSDEALAYYQKVRKHFRRILDQMEEVLVNRTKHLYRDEALTQGRKIQEIRLQFARLRERPYFPMMRFGKYAVEVKDRAGGNTVFYEMYDTVEEQELSLNEQRNRHPDDKFSTSKREVSDIERVAQGMPRDFIAMMEESFERAGEPLNEEQQKLLKNLAFEALPARSFLNHLRKRTGIEGFSYDGLRIIAAYTHNAAGYIARARYGFQMQEHIRSLRQNANLIRAAASNEVKDLSKRDQIADHLERHYNYIMNPQSEWAGLRSMGFLYYLGYNLKSAFINMTQVPFVTYPYLAARFGDARAIKTLTLANKQAMDYLTNPKKVSDDLVELIQTGMHEGWIDESLATELAMARTDGIVDRMLPLDVKGKFRARELRKLGKHFYFKAAHYGAMPFHTVEKFNRTVTAIAAYQLSREKGISHSNAIGEAKEAVQRTQYEYALWARPELMRGKKGALFLFKSYMQGSLFFALEDPGAWRYLLILMVTAGLQGLPGAEDFLDLWDTLGTKGREVAGLPGRSDIRKTLRQESAQLAEAIGVHPDIFFHGIASQSMGLGLLGEALGIPIPNVDLSGSLSMGNIFPGTDISKKIQGRNTPQELVGELVEDIGGPLGAMGMGLVSPFIRDDPHVWRRWERALPLFMRQASKATRLLSEDGVETTPGGEVIAKFDLNDPRDIAELALTTFGFTPRKLSRGSQRLIAELQAVSYWQAQKMNILRQRNYAIENRDREAVADAQIAVREYNDRVPYGEMKVNAEDMARSLRSYLDRRRVLSRGMATQMEFRRLKREYAEAYAGILSRDSQGTEVVPPAESSPPNSQQ